MNEQQKHQFESRGFLVIPDFLSESELRELDRNVDDLLDGRLKPEMADQGDVPDEFYTLWEPGKQDQPLPRRERVRLMSYMSFHHPYFRQFACHPAIYEVLSTLYGTGVQIFADTVFMKPARHGVEAELHQDTAFWGKLKPKAILSWLAVDPATVENGCMHVIPGSHHHDIEHAQDPVQQWVLREDQVEIDKQIPIELNPGDILFFDSGLAHRSYPNRSDQSRRAMTCVYVSDPVEHLSPWQAKYPFMPITAPHLKVDKV